jgi:hypothetical protein
MTKPLIIKNGDVIRYEYKKFESAEERPTVFVWDIDKTYLDTQFETLRGLFRTAFEKAFQKRNVPGTATLIRALEDTIPGKDLGLFFISASPPQMAAKIHQKMLLDRIFPLGIFFKDNLKNIRFRKFGRLKQHVGYKVQALLELRSSLKENVRMVLFGDDSESDAVIYSLFSDICNRRLKTDEILSVLTALHVLPEQRRKILEIQNEIPQNDPVEKIYINLVADTDPDYYAKFGRRVLATFTTFQAAMDLYQDQRINLESLVMVARDMIANYGFTPEELAKSFEDLHKRGFLLHETQNQLLPLLKERMLLPPNFAPAFRPAKALQKIGEKILGLEEILGLEAEDPWVPNHIDYLHDFR